MPSPSFNPASYTRASFTSPISWRPGSFGNGNRYTSPNQLDPTDFRDARKISSSMESDRGSIKNALSATEREDELCHNYTCCGLNLQDIHALVEHFEERHVVVVDPCPQPAPGQTYPHSFSAPPAKFDSYLPNSAQASRPQSQHQQPLPQLQPQHHQHPQEQHQQGPFDSDDMELDMDSSPASSYPSSPPLTPITTPLVPYTPQRGFANASPTPLFLSQPSSECPSPVSAFDTTTVLPSRASTSSISPFTQTRHDSFSSFSAYSEHGAVTSPLQASQETTGASSSRPVSPYDCVPPTLLYSPRSVTPDNIPPTSRFASLDAAQGQTQASYHRLSAQTSTSASGSPSRAFTLHANTTLSRREAERRLDDAGDCRWAYKNMNGHDGSNVRSESDLFELPADAAAADSTIAKNPPQTISHEGPQVFTLGHLLPRAGEDAGEDDANSIWTFDANSHSGLLPLPLNNTEENDVVDPSPTTVRSEGYPGDHGAVGLKSPASWQHEFLKPPQSSNGVGVGVGQSQGQPQGQGQGQTAAMQQVVDDFGQQGLAFIQQLQDPNSAFVKYMVEQIPGFMTLPLQQQLESMRQAQRMIQQTRLAQSKSAAATCQSSAMCSSTSSLISSSTKSAGSQSWNHPQGFDQSQYSPGDVVNTQPPSTQGHVSTSQSSPSCILAPPEKMHPTLSCWIKNMKKLSSLIDRLQELASSAPTEHQSHLLRQVKALRATSKKQQEQFMDFLQLSEEYANEYLLDIDAYIQQQSSFLAKLEGRLEAAKTLRGEAAELQMLYESGTVATVKNLATALPRPLPEDDALFREVDSVLTEIKQCYTELYKFWTEEISRAMEAFEKRRVDRTDFERWRNFHTNLKQTIESWKGELPSGDVQTVLRNNACLSTEADIGTIASSMSFAMSSVTSALERLPSTNSLKYLPSCQPYIQRVYLALRGNRDLCLSFLRRCADYGEKVIGCRSSTALPTPSRMMALHDLRERTMRLLSETTDVSVENAASVQGLRKFKAAYKKARYLEETTTSGLKTLLGSWTTDCRVFRDDDFPDVITPEQLRGVWEKARYSVRAALANLKDEPAPELFYRSPPLVSTRLQSVIKRWITKLVFFS